MKLLTHLLVYGASLAVLTAQAPARPAITATELDARLDRFIERVMTDLNVVPGLAAAVVRGDEVVYRGGFGFADLEARRKVTPDTPFYTASMIKAFTGMTGAVLHVNGRLDLDAPLTTLLPGLTLPDKTDVSRATTRGLLSHNAGFASQTVNYVNSFVRGYTREELVRVMNATSQVLPTFTYANAHFIVAGHVIEQAPGAPWQQAMNTLVLAPLGMRSTQLSVSRISTVAQPYLVGPDGPERLRFAKTDATMTPAGGAFTTVLDAAKFLRASMNEGRLDGRQVIPQAAVRLQQTQQVALDAQFGEYTRTGYGLGLYLGRYDGERLLHHFGGSTGYRSHLSWMPDHGVGVVVFVNDGDDGAGVADLVANYVYDLVLGRDAETRAADRIAKYPAAIAKARAAREAWRPELRAARAAAQVPPLPLTAYAGVFDHARLGAVTINAGAGGLTVQFGDLQGPVIPAGGHTFLVDWNPGNAPARWRFIETDGRITGADWEGRPLVRR